MNRKEFVRRVASKMRDDNVRKIISSPKHVFHISDDEGNSKDFVIKKADKGVLFSIEDIGAIVDACVAVIEETIRSGEHITFHGFGTLGLNYRRGRKVKHPETGEETEIPGMYVPKFTSGKDLKMCAKVFELSMAEHFAESLDHPVYTQENGLADDSDIGDDDFECDEFVCQDGDC